MKSELDEQKSVPDEVPSNVMHKTEIPASADTLEDIDSVKDSGALSNTVVTNSTELPVTAKPNHVPTIAKQSGVLTTILHYLRIVEPQAVLLIVISLLYLGFRKSTTRLGKWISFLEDRLVQTVKMATNTSSL
jgi:hypothetical protein